MKERSKEADKSYEEPKNNGDPKKTHEEVGATNGRRDSPESRDEPDAKKNGLNDFHGKQPNIVRKQNEKANIIKRFLFFCAGIEGVIVEKEAFSIEHSKYVSIGLAVLYTAILSGLSGGYAMSTIFESRKVFIAFGILWSSIILNLDRLILIGLRREGSSTQGPFVRLGLDVMGILSRLLLACFIGVIVSEPLKLRLFQSEINKEHAKILVSEGTEELKAKNKPIIEGKKESIRRLEEQLKFSNSEISRLNAQVGGEVVGNNGGDPGYGSQAKTIERAASSEKNNRGNLSGQISELEGDIDELLNEEVTTKTDQNVSFLNSMKAMHELSKDPTIRNVNLFITALFVVMEILPVFLKIIFAKGMYEELHRESERSI